MIRPSSLPKLAECVRFEGMAGAGPAAERGNVLDKLYREVLGGVAELDPNNDDHRGIAWAVGMTRILANKQADDVGPEIFTTESILWKEDELRVQAMGMQGTADCALPHARTSIDLKTGQERNYMEQQSLYALGFMSRYNVDRWTVVLIYSDLRTMKTLDFTRPWAESIIRNLMARVNDPQSVATPCDYCNWCKNKFTCEPRLEKVAWWYKQSGDAIDWDKELDDPDKLAQFLDLCSIISRDGGLHDLAKEKAKAILSGGGKLTGFGLRSRKGTEFIEPKDIAQHVDALGIDAILAAYGNMRAEKFRGLWEAKLGSEPVPTSIIQSGPGSSYVSATKKTTKPQP